MISKNFKILLALIFAALIFSPLKGEDKIDIWKNKKNNGNIDSNQSNTVNKKDDIKPNLAEPVEANQDILITDGAIDNSKEIKVFGVYDPADYNFNLNMWSTTKAEDVRSSIKRIKKTKKRPLLYNKNLSVTVNKIYLERKKTYSEADFRIKCNFLGPDKIVDKILKLYEKSGN